MLRFYLNVVGYKVVMGSAGLLTAASFYLNVVGYKDGVLDAKHMLKSRFI